MSSAIEKLQADVADSNVSAVNLLQRAIPLAKKYGDDGFISWANRELRGYSAEDPECPYRRLKGQYVVLTNEGRVLPIHWQDSGSDMKARSITLPLAEAESLLSGDGDTFAVKINVDPKALRGLQVEPGDTIGFSVSRSTISGFLSAIRQRVLDWTLKLPTETGSTAPAAVAAQDSSTTVFYSWQSDLPNRTNRGFIEECLERAIKELKAEGELRVEPCVDRDTKNVPGSPDIAATIFEKIEACALFVCDVSLINKGATGRLTPNPNVLIELGYAVKTLGWKRVVCVFNEATGTIEDLPFDLRHRRVRAYRLDDGQEKADVRKLLAQLLKGDLQAAFSFTQVTEDPSEADNLLPSVEVLSAVLECQPPVATPAVSYIHHPRPQYLEGRLIWTVTASLFLDARPGESLSVALHRCTGWMNDRYTGKQMPLTEIAIQSEPRSQVSVDDAVVLIRGPGRFSIQARCETPFRDSGYPDVVRLELRLPVTERGGTPIEVALEVSQTPYGGDWPIRWNKRPSGAS